MGKLPRGRGPKEAKGSGSPVGRTPWQPLPSDLPTLLLLSAGPCVLSFTHSLPAAASRARYCNTLFSSKGAPEAEQPGSLVAWGVIWSAAGQWDSGHRALSLHLGLGVVGWEDIWGII